jgi:hypothetical protein
MDDSPDASGRRIQASDELREVEMVNLNHQGVTSSPSLFRARVIGVIARDDVTDDSFEDLDTEHPSTSAVLAVRLCVWAFFLFGFLMLFHNQQQKFMQDRIRQGGKLRSSQLLHIMVPWTETSNFNSKESCYLSQFVDSSPYGFGIQRIFEGKEAWVLKRNGVGPISSSGTSLRDNVFQIQVTAGSTIHLKRDSDGVYTFEHNQQNMKINLQDDIALFRYFPSTSSSLVVARPKSVESTDCLIRFGPTGCTDSRPIPRGKAYYFDQKTDMLVSIGTDSVPVDGGGGGLNGISVQTISPNDAKVDLSFTVPFINRFEEGIWSFQNSPLTDGFIVLLPVMGFPPAPVQHVVSLNDLSDEVRKGAVLRMENEDLQLFRKVDTIPYSSPQVSQGICSC